MTPSATLRALLAGAIDYAGLFPPARLSMRDAIQRYAAYVEGPDSWALGRFVVPVARLDELGAIRASMPASSASWRLSAILGSDVAADGAAIRRFNEANVKLACVDAAEMKVAGAASSAREEIGAAIRALPCSARVFAEVPLSTDLRSLVWAAGAAHACAKVRTGGVTPGAFPSPNDLAAFLSICAEEAVPFKATAGLHHPWRGSYPLTYDAAAPHGTMFGFLNVFVAAAAARSGVANEQIIAMLHSEQAAEFCFGEDEIVWRDVRVSRAQMLESRSSFALSFGSCSFEEPIQDLRALSLL